MIKWLTRMGGSWRVAEGHLILAEKRRRVPVCLPAPRPFGLRMTHARVGVTGQQTAFCMRLIRYALGWRARSLATGRALGFDSGRAATDVAQVSNSPCTALGSHSRRSTHLLQRVRACEKSAADRYARGSILPL